MFFLCHSEWLSRIILSSFSKHLSIMSNLYDLIIIDYLIFERPLLINPVTSFCVSLLNVWVGNSKNYESLSFLKRWMTTFLKNVKFKRQKCFHPLQIFFEFLSNKKLLACCQINYSGFSSSSRSEQANSFPHLTQNVEMMKLTMCLR
jgi:hypothetical protein